MNYQCLLIVRLEMLQFSRNDQYIKCSGPPEHFAIANVHSDNLPLGIIALKLCHVKQLQEGLMVLSDDMLLFLKFKKKFVKFTKTILGL